VNASHFPANQTETTITASRTNPNWIFAAANHGAFREPDQGPNDPIAEQGIFTSHSEDGGATWVPRVIANGTDALPVACCDPSAAYDEFGNLFFTYLAMDPASGSTSIVVLTSADNGQTFTLIGNFSGAAGAVDRNEVAAGNGQLWVTFVDFAGGVEAIQAVGAPVTGAGQVGQFGTPQSLPQSGLGAGAPFSSNVAHPAIGPDGQVMVTWQTVGTASMRERIYVNTDPDGVGPAPFGNAVFVDDTEVGTKEPLPGQSERGLSAVPTLAYDRSTGPHRGRAYISYTQEVSQDRNDSVGRPINASGDTDILLRFSDDNGASWSPAIRVNDDAPTSQASQFFQRVAVDQTTGNVAVGWLDTRDDAEGPGRYDEVGYYLTVGAAAGNGVNFAPNIRLNVGKSNARLSGNLGNDYGDYTGLDINNGVVWALYPDNSNSTGDNPSGRLRAFDIYAARARVLPDTTPPEPPFVTPASPLSPTPIKAVTLVRKGRFYTLRMSYTHPSGIDLATPGDNDLLVTGPNGFSQNMQLVRAARRARGTNVLATYRLAAPGGTWDAAENGHVYTITLAAGAVSATDGTATSAGTVTKFLVNAPTPGRRGNRREVDSRWGQYEPRTRPGDGKEHEGEEHEEVKRESSATGLLAE
jgi:hypothetical protein